MPALAAFIPASASCSRLSLIHGAVRRVLPAAAASLLLAPQAWCAGAMFTTQAPSAPPQAPRQTFSQPQISAPSAQSVPAPAPAAAPAATPARPSSPANEHASVATVEWVNHTLRIVATNASLLQILQEISAKTGAALRGAGEDQRIFGVYGPGTARDVLSQLLEGSGYNVMIIGDQGHGTPRSIVLSARPAGTAQPAPAYTPPQPSDEDNDTDQQAQEPQQDEVPPPPVQSNPVPATPGRTPQDMQRQLQLQQQQQQQQLPEQTPQN